jgi:hypothetical protein
LKSKKLLVAAFIAATLVSCSQQFEDIELGDGFYLHLKGANTLLHMPGNEQLWRKDGYRRHIVWPYIVGKTIVSDGVAVFNGGLTDDREWKGNPALFVYYKSGPAIEVSEGITKFYAEKENKPYAELREKYAYKWPSFKNGVLAVSGNRKPAWRVSDVNSNWIDVSVTIEDLIRIASKTKAEGDRKKYRGAEYIIGR